MLDSGALETFLAVHRAGGISAAAEILLRSQPAISRRIAQLEAALGVPLFERGGGGLTLSEAGRALLPHAERVGAAVQDAAAAIADLRDTKSGHVALAAVGTLAGSGLTAVLARFAAAHPGVRLDLRTATSDQVSALVRRGEAGLGLRYLRDPAPELESHPLAADPMVVVAAPSHRLAGRRVQRLTALAGERWLAFPRPDESGEVSAETIFAEFRRRGVAAIDWSPVDSLTAQKRLAEAGFGISLMPRSAAAEELKAGTLALITIGDLDAANPIFAIVRRNAYRSAATEALLALLRDDAGRRVRVR